MLGHTEEHGALLTALQASSCDGFATLTRQHVRLLGSVPPAHAAAHHAACIDAYVCYHHLQQKDHFFTEIVDELPRSAWDPLFAALNQQVTTARLSMHGCRRASTRARDATGCCHICRLRWRCRNTTAWKRSKHLTARHRSQRAGHQMHNKHRPWSMRHRLRHAAHG
jgi:hypothetical protein